MNVIKFPGRKKGRHLKDRLLLGGTIRYIGLFCLPCHSYRTMSTSSCLRTWYCLNALIFGNISSACVKEYLIAATY